VGEPVSGLQRFVTGFFIYINNVYVYALDVSVDNT